MDPVGPWSAYASYNRLAGVQATSTGADLHHHIATGTAAPPTTSAQLLPGGFLSPPPVTYETVFSPLFHHAAAAGAKPPTHYVTQVTQQRAQALVQASKQNEGEYHQPQAFFEQGPWQPNSPFGILPHESVVATTTSNFNAHFAQSLNHLATKNSRAQSPQVTSASTNKTPASQPNSATFFQVPSTFANTGTTSASKLNSSSSANLQQSCIVSSPSNTTKEYRVPQGPPRAVFLAATNVTRPPQPKQQAQVQTKAQTKIYPELNSQGERARGVEEGQSQSSPISFSMDAPGRLSYSGSNSSGKRGPQFQHASYRHYQQQGGGSLDAEFQRTKTGPEYPPSNGPDCNVVVPRRPSPLQARSQASPLGHAPSPAYPMYNSPMNPISSPQHNSSNQVTPPSPLDVSVPRPNSTQSGGNVAYPSVITRALNTDKGFQERYDRNQNAQQNCWDERQQQSRKFQASGQTNSQSTSSYSAAGNGLELARGAERGQQQQQQTGYFEAGHQVTLQDLSSCRGDPMSIVKNLQQQQSCQVQQPEIKQEKQPAKRRKSNEKPNVPVAEIAGSTIEYFTGRIPPPAHTSASQQQQNGTYVDFDRWNLPPPTARIFTSQAVHPQHQGLMVPHPHTHHPPPPLPYFPPFHLAPHPPEFGSTVELAPISASYGEQGQQQQAGQYGPPQQQPQQVDNQPKVVVPNIEEELNFLSEGGRPATSTSTAIHRPPVPPQPAVAAITKPTEKPKGPGAGFMNSYLKFLQGERDSSPPPTARGARKQSWSRTTNNVKTVLQMDASKPAESNGVPVVIPPVIPAPVMRLSQGDPQDDPRYFPLPKERKRRSFDSSDDDFSSDDDLFNRKLLPVMMKSEQGHRTKNARKTKPTKKNSSSSEKKRSKNSSLSRLEKQRLREEREREKEQAFSDYEELSLPRRETSKRAAKEKSNIKQLIDKQGDDDPEEPPELADSDSDPVWTPSAKNDEEVEPVMEKRKRRGRPPGSSKKKPKSEETDANNYVSAQTKKQKAANKQKSALTLEDNIAAAVAMQEPVPAPGPDDDNPFKPGEFVAIKSELRHEWPSIWRVDGKTLLQKYEPFEQNGQTLYRNIATYTSWTSDSKKQYVSVPVRYKLQGQMETVVEFLRNELTVIDEEFFESAIRESENYQDNFEVYIQTLISQALDSNFLTEIFQERDEYFLSNVKTIDDITEGKRRKLLGLLEWPQAVQVAVTTWPCFNVIRELNLTDALSHRCDACLQAGVAVRMLMYGQPYNSTTLEGCPPNPQAVSEKNFLMCRVCAQRVELLSKVSHQKYLMYIECAKRVAEKRTTEAHKDTTCILNELLADENWLNFMFLEVRKSWAEVDSLEHSYQMKNAKVQ